MRNYYQTITIACCMAMSASPLAIWAQLAPPSRTILNRARGVLATSRFFCILFNFQSLLIFGTSAATPSI